VQAVHAVHPSPSKEDRAMTLQGSSQRCRRT
jgi:hypothetical protein